MGLSVKALISNYGTLTERLSALHQQLLETVPSVGRIACALYDASDDSLKTFINSTREGKAITGYEYKLADSDPPPLKWSDLKYVLWHQGGSEHAKEEAHA